MISISAVFEKISEHPIVEHPVVATIPAAMMGTGLANHFFSLFSVADNIFNFLIVVLGGMASAFLLMTNYYKSRKAKKELADYELDRRNLNELKQVIYNQVKYGAAGLNRRASDEELRLFATERSESITHRREADEGGV